jgi:hypothetical protein
MPKQRCDVSVFLPAFTPSPHVPSVGMGDTDDRGQVGIAEEGTFSLGDDMDDVPPAIDAIDVCFILFEMEGDGFAADKAAEGMDDGLVRRRHDFAPKRGEPIDGGCTANGRKGDKYPASIIIVLKYQKDPVRTQSYARSPSKLKPPHLGLSLLLLRYRDILLLLPYLLAIGDLPFTRSIDRRSPDPTPKEGESIATATLSPSS